MATVVRTINITVFAFFYLFKNNRKFIKKTNEQNNFL